MSLRSWILALGIVSACKEPTESRLRDQPATELKGDLPPLGRSLFDALTMKEISPGVYEQKVPFPFQELRSLIESQSQMPALVTLIPKGRSLQRNASTEPFKFPRVVLAVPGESHPENALLLKDRLYIGYVESAEQLEVLSFNPLAGRFEFQVVEAYAAGKTPEVRYANRSFCQSCHQNEAPLFSLPPWDETVASASVADRVQKARTATSYLNIPIKQFANIPNEIDNSTDRANLLAPYQKLWRDGCRQDDAKKTRQCRRLILELTLSYVWDGDLPADVMDKFQALTAPAWTEWWPTGLALISPDLPNFFSEGAVPPAADPLQDRRGNPWQTWDRSAGDDFRVIFGVLENLQASDLNWLVQHKDLRPRLMEELASWESRENSPLNQVAFDRCVWFVPLIQTVDLDVRLSCRALEHPAWPMPTSTGNTPGELGQDLSLFMKSCGRCHQSGPRPFLAGSTEFEILQNLRKNAAQHRQRLEWEKTPARSMPPSGSAERQHLESNPNERADMLRLLREWSS